jgi:hypothetical protein
MEKCADDDGAGLVKGDVAALAIYAQAPVRGKSGQFPRGKYSSGFGNHQRANSGERPVYDARLRRMPSAKITMRR